jgi:hypothetical protein
MILEALAPSVGTTMEGTRSLMVPGVELREGSFNDLGLFQGN